MNRIDKKFEELKKQGKKALIPFLTAGDPDLETTEKLVLTLEQAGADLLELGVPFSDPIAEGIEVGQASIRSLNNGTTLVKIFELIKRVRQVTEIPILLTLYQFYFPFRNRAIFCTLSGMRSRRCYCAGYAL